VDSTQVERFRSQLQRILFLQAYIFPTREEAQAWYTKIVMGTPVSKLEALAKAGGPGAPNYVDLGHKIREDFNAETANVVFSLAPGRLSPPVSSVQGWALIQVTGSRPRPNSIAAGSREGVIKEMRRLASVSLKEVYRDSLAKSVRITYRDAAMDTILNRFLVLKERATPMEGGGASFNMFQPMPAYQPGDSALVLATSDLGPVTGGDLYRFLAHMGTSSARRRSREQLRPWVDRVAFDQLLLREAIAKGYDQNPSVLRQVQSRRERYQVESLYADSVSDPIRVPEAEARAAYQADTLAWIEHETVRMWVCAVPSKAVADSLLRAGQKGGTLKEIAYNFTTLEQFAQNGGMTQAFVREQCPTPSATDSIFKTAVGSFGGPIASNEGWVIFKVVQHNPDRMRPYSEVHDEVVRVVRNDREEAAMQLFLGRLRQRYPVEKHEEWLVKMAGQPAATSPDRPKQTEAGRRSASGGPLLFSSGVLLSNRLEIDCFSDVEHRLLRF
jgi:hypothetical protein